MLDQDFIREKQPQGSVGLLTKGNEETENESGKFAHIVKGSPKKTAAAIITEALVLGTEVEALCGYRWVPSRDPKNYPVCPKCKDIHELYKLGFGKNFPISGS